MHHHHDQPLLHDINDEGGYDYDHDHDGWHHHHGPVKLNYDIIVHHNHPPSYHDDPDRYNYHHTLAGYHLDPADHDHDDA